MYNGIGLPTPRGSGTNGYVQRNVANVSLLGPSRRVGYQPTKKVVEDSLEEPSLRKPDPDILDHERRRKAVVLSLELEEKLKKENILSEEQIQELVSKVRTQLMTQTQVDLAVDNNAESVNQLLQDVAEEADRWKKASMNKRRKLRVGFAGDEPTLGLQFPSRPTFRDYDIHRKSLAKEKENLKLKNALGLGDDYQPGAVFRISRTEEEEEPVTQQVPAAPPPLAANESKSTLEEPEEERYPSTLDTTKEDGELEVDEGVVSGSPERSGIHENKHTETESEGRGREKSHKLRHRTSSRRRSSSRNGRRHRASSSGDRKHKRRHRHHSSRREYYRE